MSGDHKEDYANGAHEELKTVDEQLGFEKFRHLATNAIHSGYNPMDFTQLSCPVIPPISLATTFGQVGPGEDFGYDYSRAGNPTRDALEKCIASLENAKHCTTFASGLAATNSLVQLLKSGDHILCIDDAYGGTGRYFRTVLSRFNVNTEMIDMSDICTVEKKFKKGVTKMVWIETPTNPLMKLVDIEALTSKVKSIDPEVMVVVDNTFMSSYFQRPLDFGADVSMHSLTKYMNGHSDVVMGACITNNTDIHNQLVYLQKAVGGIPSPFDCYLVLRGLRTLHVRMREHMRCGLSVARFLETHPLVEKVIHPGLESHPQHKLTKKQMRGYSGMVSLYIRGDAALFVKNLRMFSLAESLGGHESLAEIPSLMTHMSVPPEDRAALGISDNLVRLSCGLEDVDDVIADLDQALEIAAKSTQPSSKKRRTSKKN